MPATKVYLSTLGAVVDPEDARISVFDRGFLYGDSVYETLRTVGGKPAHWSSHLDRLHRSAAAIGLEIPFGADEIVAAVERTHAASANDESYVRVVVTRGAGPIALDPRRSGSPTLVVIVQPLELPLAAIYQQGISAVIVTVDKAGGGLDPNLKTGNYLSNIQALRQAIARGADDAILCNRRGEVSEGSTSNVFVVTGGRVRTPDLGAGLLAGITRQHVLELARQAGIPVEEGAIDPDTLRGADEVFLTSSVRGIMPVTRIDGLSVGSGMLGPITAILRELYAASLGTASENLGPR